MCACTLWTTGFGENQYFFRVQKKDELRTDRPKKLGIRECVNIVL